MKLILHHLLKDIRAQRWLLLLWAFVILIQIVVDLLIAQPGYDVANIAEHIRSSPLLGLVSGLIWIFLLVQLIQSEPVTGSSSFWLTRPVPRGVYISSKLIFIVFLVFAPALLITPLNMLELHANPTLIGPNVRSGLWLQAGVAICVIWLATFTRSLGRFVGAGALLIPISVTLYGLKQWGTISHSAFRSPDLLFTRALIFMAIFFGGLLVSLVLQHLIRRTPAGLIIGLAAVFVALLAGFWWPFALPLRFTVGFLTSNHLITEKNTKVDFTPDWQASVTWRTDSKTKDLTALAPLTSAESNGNGVPIVEGISAHFQSKPGTPAVLAVPKTISWDDDHQFDLRKAVQADLPEITIDGDAPAESTVELFTLDPVAAAELEGKIGALNLSLYGHLKTLVRKAAIPLGENAFVRLPGETIHVHRLARATQSLFGIDMPTGDDKPVLAVWDVAYLNKPFWKAPSIFYLLVDPQNHTGSFLRPTNIFSHLTAMTGFSARSNWRDFLLLNGNEPLERMVLYIYEVMPGDSFESTLTAPDFIMNPK